MNKKTRAKHSSAGSTQFIRATSLDDSLAKLSELSWGAVQLLKADNGKHEFEVLVIGTGMGARIYVTIQVWNEVETLVSIAPTNLVALLNNGSDRLIAIIFGLDDIRHRFSFNRTFAWALF